MSYELYTMAGSCSMAVHAVMNEMGLNPTIHIVEKNDGANGIKNPSYLKMNPRGNVPLMVEDGHALREGGAIITYLCDKHKSALIPQSGWERAQALQWLMFANATLHPAYSRTFWIASNTPAGEMQDAAIKAARAQIQNLWDEVEMHLAANGPHVCGANCTAGDIVLSVIANWNPAAYKFGPKTAAMFKAVIARPAYQKTLAAEAVEYKAAA